MPGRSRPRARAGSIGVIKANHKPITRPRRAELASARQHRGEARPTIEERMEEGCGLAFLYRFPHAAAEGEAEAAKAGLARRAGEGGGANDQKHTGTLHMAQCTRRTYVQLVGA